MPLFFLLSGFCLTIGYGRKQYTSSSRCCGPCSKSTKSCCFSSQDKEEEEVLFDSWNFYKGRLTRILPVYYACLLYAFPLMFLGHSHFAVSNYLLGLGGSFLALFLQQSVVIILGFGPCGPSWTVSTIFFFYWFFPWYEVPI